MGKRTVRGVPRGVPVFERVKHALYFPGFEIAAHGVLDLELALFLVEFSFEDVEIDGIDDEVFEFAHGGHVERLHEGWIRQNLRGGE